MPQHLAAGGTIEESCGIERIIIKERECRVDLPLECCIGVGIVDQVDLEIYMETRSRRHSVFRLHVIAAEHKDIRHIREQFIQKLRRDPLCRIVAVIVVTVHRDIVRENKVVLAAGVILVFRTDVVAALHLCHIRLRGHNDLIRVDAVCLVVQAVSLIDCYLHTSSNSSVK